jgi:nucleotide-binding universal stress UspA family protein
MTGGQVLPVRKIVCPIDFSEPSYAALKTAGELARHFGAFLDVIHVIPPVPVHSPYPDPPLGISFDVPLYQQELAVYSEKIIKDVVGKMVSQEIGTLATILTGDPAQEILAFATRENAGLIIIATHGQTGWRHLISGSVAEKVVRLASCPVLTLRAPHGEKPEK